MRELNKLIEFLPKDSEMLIILQETAEYIFEKVRVIEPFSTEPREFSDPIKKMEFLLKESKGLKVLIWMEYVVDDGAFEFLEVVNIVDARFSNNIFIIEVCGFGSNSAAYGIEINRKFDFSVKSNCANRDKFYKVVDFRMEFL